MSALLIVIIILLCLFLWTYYKLVIAVHLFGKSLKDKVVLVTGAGNGIGKELCLQLAKEGCHVICVDVEEKANNKTKEEVLQISNGSIRVEAFTCDLTANEKVQELPQKVCETFGHVDILVNNVGIFLAGKLLDYSEQEVHRTFGINVYTHIWMIKAFLPNMLDRNCGHIVATASIASKIPVGALIPYSAAKYAVFGLMQSLKYELLALYNKNNIKLTTVCPFAIGSRLISDDFKNMRINRLHMCTPSDCAKIILDGIKLELPWFTVPRSFWIILPALEILPHCITNPVANLVTRLLYKYTANKIDALKKKSN